MKNKFKTKNIRTVSSPSNKDVTTYFVWTEFKDLPPDLSLEVNPRKPKMNTAVAKQLINAVSSTDVPEFDLNNRGIVITAKQVKFNSDTSEVTIDFGDDPLRYGILDGGHTYTAIVENRDNLPDDVEKYVRLEILVGESLDVAGLADARNTSLQVSDVALYELDDKFDFIKDAISDQSFADDIAYKDNEDKPIQVAELLKLMFAFNIKRYPDDSNAPVPAYSAKAAVFRDFRKNYDEEVSEENEDVNIYRKLAKFLPDLVKLYERIQKDLPDKFVEFKKNEEGQKKPNFGGIRGIESKKATKRKDCLTLFTKESINYEISNAYLLPIFGAFRALLNMDDHGEVDWRFNPIGVWERAGIRLVQNTFDTDTNPQMVGKSKTLWQSNYRIVDSVRKDMIIEEFETGSK